jgi:hypothetical protein
MKRGFSPPFSLYYVTTPEKESALRRSILSRLTKTVMLPVNADSGKASLSHHDEFEKRCKGSETGR